MLDKTLNVTQTYLSVMNNFSSFRTVVQNTKHGFQLQFPVSLISQIHKKKSGTQQELHVFHQFVVLIGNRLVRIEDLNPSMKMNECFLVYHIFFLQKICDFCTNGCITEFHVYHILFENLKSICRHSQKKNSNHPCNLVENGFFRLNVITKITTFSIRIFTGGVEIFI